MRSRTLTLQDAVESFLVALRADGVKPETISWYRHRLSRFIALYGKRDVRSISIDEVRAYIVMVRKFGYWGKRIVANLLVRPDFLIMQWSIMLRKFGIV